MAGKMRYKDFTWPHNPASCNVSYNKRIVAHTYPEIDGAEYEELGTEPRVVTGSGVFFGKGAYNYFKRLVKFYDQKTSGVLIHPTWGSMRARLVKLTSQEEPLPNYVEYTFEFVEHTDINLIAKKSTSTSGGNSNSGNSGNNSSNKKYHIVKSGETLGGISQKYYGKASEWKKIANANKNLIKDPNFVQVGWKLLIP